MPGGGRKPLEGGDYPAREIAHRVEARRNEIGVKAEACCEVLGLSSLSGWSKRTNTERADWVPLRVDEISVLKRLLAPDDPGWPFFSVDEQRRVNRALGAAPPSPATAPTPAQSAGPHHRAAGRHRE